MTTRAAHTPGEVMSVTADEDAATSAPNAGASSTAPDAKAPNSGAFVSPALATPTPGGVLTRRAPESAFEVHLDVFSGPFDLLLGLISKHKLDITEIALAQVTDEFIAHIRAQQAHDVDWDLSQASEFLLVAATLLDIKAARLLPQLGGDDDDEDLALIEARDLLFARLLQYRAFKDVAAWTAQRMQTHGRIVPRQAGLEPRFAALLPELVLSVSAQQLARVAARAMVPRAVPTVGVDHLHAPTVSVREQAAIVVARLRVAGRLTFRDLVADAEDTLVVVGRFLALLELFREAAVAFDQPEALGELVVDWTGSGDFDLDVGGDFDDEPPVRDTDAHDAATHDTNTGGPDAADGAGDPPTLAPPVPAPRPPAPAMPARTM